jgi:DNA-binding NarL/FixJ family response regulator
MTRLSLLRSFMTTVALLHRHPVLGLRLAEQIAATPGLEVTGVAGSLPVLREIFARHVPDLLLVDLMLPALHVHTVLADVHLRGDAGPKLLVLAVSADDPRVMDALRNGADSYYAHAHSPLTLPAAVEQLMRGESSITPQIARNLKSHFDARTAAISDTDRRLLQWIAEGFLVSEVAHAMRLSAHAVGVRIRDLYRCLQTDVRGDSPAAAA